MHRFLLAAAVAGVAAPFALTSTAYAAEAPAPVSVTVVADQPISIIVKTSSGVEVDRHEVPAPTKAPTSSTPTPTATPTATPTSAEAPAGAAAELEEPSMADEVFRLTNLEREKHGLPPFERDDCLTASAQKVTEQMAEANVLEHSDLSGIKECGFEGGENIASGYESAAEVVAGWMSSTEGHREAILSKEYKKMGPGHVPGETPYFTQHFA